MRFSRARTYLMAGLIGAAGVTAGSIVAATPASAVTSNVVIVNCHDHGVVKPAGFDNGCNPSQEFMTKLSWTSWRNVAYGAGTLKVNNCNPSCAQGKYVGYPILVVLWRAEKWPGHTGQRYFTRMTFIFTAARSNPGPAARTITLSPTGG